MQRVGTMHDVRLRLSARQRRHRVNTAKPAGSHSAILILTHSDNAQSAGSGDPACNR